MIVAAVGAAQAIGIALALYAQVFCLLSWRFCKPNGWLTFPWLRR